MYEITIVLIVLLEDFEACCDLQNVVSSNEWWVVEEESGFVICRTRVWPSADAIKAIEDLPEVDYVFVESC